MFSSLNVLFCCTSSELYNYPAAVSTIVTLPICSKLWSSVVCTSCIFEYSISSRFTTSKLPSFRGRRSMLFVVDVGKALMNPSNAKLSLQNPVSVDIAVLCFSDKSNGCGKSLTGSTDCDAVGLTELVFRDLINLAR